MKLELVAKNYKVTERLNQILVTKLNRLDKYFPDGNTPIKVVLNGDEKKCRMEVSIYYHGTEIRSEVTGDTMYYIVDSILPKLERQIIKYREKLNERYKMPAVVKDEYLYISEVEETKPATIAKVKKFPIQAIDVKEAIENLEMTQHDFYLFINAASGNVEAVYRRKNGSVGLLQPYEE